MDLVLRRARVATVGYFALNGFVLGMWVVHIPSIERHVHISPATLGWLLLVLGVGGLAGMQAVGRVVDRLGTRRVVPVCGVLCGIALLGPAFAASGWQLGLALFGLGVGNGALDVSMNTHAVQVEARYGRPVMSAFHAMYSVGGFAASLVGAATLRWGWHAEATLSGVAVLAVLAALVSAPALLPRPTEHPEPLAHVVRGRTPRTIWVLAAIAVVLLLTEGVANDWSVLAAKDDLHVSASVAALAYGGFAGAMTVGRLVADRVAARYGSIAILRWGSLVAAGALAMIVLSPWYALTLVGWVVLGLGLSGTVPQVFSAAGHADPSAAGANVSRVGGVGYLGLLAGPSVIGPLTHLMAIKHTFVVPLVLCVVVSVTAVRYRGLGAGGTGVEPARDSASDRIGHSRS